MPTFVPSSFSSTISDSSARKRRDSASPRCLSSSVPLDPKRWGVLGYFTNSPYELPMTNPRTLEHRHLCGCPKHLIQRTDRQEPNEVAVPLGDSQQIAEVSGGPVPGRDRQHHESVPPTALQGSRIRRPAGDPDIW